MRSLVICTTCKFSPEAKLGPDGRSGGEMLLAHVRDVVGERADISVEPQACLWNCTRFCSVVMRDTSRFSYVTGSNVPTRDQAEGIVAWFDAHGQTETGEVPFKQWPQTMRGHFIARMPPERP